MKNKFLYEFNKKENKRLKRIFYLESDKNVWESLFICIVKMDSKFFNRDNINNSFKYWNNIVWNNRSK